MAGSVPGLAQNRLLQVAAKVDRGPIGMGCESVVWELVPGRRLLQQRRGTSLVPPGNPGSLSGYGREWR